MVSVAATSFSPNPSRANEPIEDPDDGQGDVFATGRCGLGTRSVFGEGLSLRSQTNQLKFKGLECEKDPES